MTSLLICQISVGSRAARYTDRNSMPYTMSFIAEALRICIAFGSLSHYSTRDVIVRGHKIPQGQFYPPCSLLHVFRIQILPPSHHKHLPFIPFSFLSLYPCTASFLIKKMHSYDQGSQPESIKDPYSRCEEAIRENFDIWPYHSTMNSSELRTYFYSFST